MKRREFLKIGVAASAGAMVVRSLKSAQAFAADGAKKALVEKNILKDGQPATISNYCQHPEKQPNKACPGWKEKPGNCKTCQFFNKDNSLAEFKGTKYAHCQLLTDPSKPQYVSENGWCATYVKLP